MLRDYETEAETSETGIIRIIINYMIMSCVTITGRPCQMMRS